MLKKLIEELRANGDPQKVKLLSSFFKTGKGQYAEGDIFIGIKVPLQRKIAASYYGLSLDGISRLLHDRIHEFRLTALLILIEQFRKADAARKAEIFKLYMEHAERINNWDLVDLSAPKIPGAYLLDRPRDVLYELAVSENLWKRRISIISTFAFIRQKDFTDCLMISEILLQDSQDLIQKAVGWMLREIGKLNQDVEEEFLSKYHKIMPRTMLRYAIEKFSAEKRAFYMSR